jgi:hypothetical protein
MNMKKILVTVYQSYTYEVEVSEEESKDWAEDAAQAYEFINENGIEPIDFGTDDITIEEI